MPNGQVLSRFLSIAVLKKKKAFYGSFTWDTLLTIQQKTSSFFSIRDVW
jgi:hypothetical protein